MKLEKKAQQLTIGQMMIGLTIFGFLLIGIFSTYTSFLNDTGATFAPSIDLSLVNRTFENSTTLANTIQNNSKAVPSYEGFDFLAMGLDSITSTFNSLELFANFITFVRNESWFGLLPNEFWLLIIAIVVLTIIFVILGAVWRYNMGK